MEDVEAQKQIEQMVKFIMTEAQDKAAEMEAKSMEDFNVEKLKVLQAMKDRVRDENRKRAKALETERAIAKSTAVNKARLKVIAARQMKINEASKSAKKSLNELSSDSAKYGKLCVDLIVQAMLRVLEDEMLVRCRKEDVAVLSKCIDAAKEKYCSILSEATGCAVKVKLSLDTNEYLLSAPTKEDERGCTGGVVVTSADGRIVCDNSLDKRLELCSKESLPQLRRVIYGN